MSFAAPRLLAFALLLAACKPAPPEGATLRVATTADAADLIAANTRMGLTTPDGAGGVMPGLARSWRIADDGRSAVFRLRPATWPGGERLAAREVVAALNAARRAGPLAAHLAGITATAPLPDVVELRLDAPRPELLELLADSALAPRRRGRGLAPYASAGEGRIARADDWPGEPPPLAAVTVRALPRDAAVAAFNAGQVDLVLGDGAPPAGAAPDAALRVAPSRRALSLRLDWRRAPLSTPAVRQALSLAIDRAGLAAMLGGVAAETLSPPILGASSPPARAPFVQAQERARALLAGAEPAIRLAVRAQDRAVAERLASDWAAVGFRVQVMLGDPAAALAAGRADAALAERAAPAATPLAYLQGFECRANRQSVCVPVADAALARARGADTPEARAAAFAEADSALVEAGAAVPLAQLPGWALVSPRIAGWVDNPAAVHPFARLDLLPPRRLLPR